MKKVVVTVLVLLMIGVSYFGLSMIHHFFEETQTLHGDKTLDVSEEVVGGLTVMDIGDGEALLEVDDKEEWYEQGEYVKLTGLQDHKGWYYIKEVSGQSVTVSGHVDIAPVFLCVLTVIGLFLLLQLSLVVFFIYFAIRESRYHV